MFTASVDSRRRQNGVLFRNDLADLSKTRPSWKYRFLTRVRVNFRVRRDFPRIVGFSENAPCFALSFGPFGRLSEIQK